MADRTERIPLTMTPEERELIVRLKENMQAGTPHRVTLVGAVLAAVKAEAKRRKVTA